MNEKRSYAALLEVSEDIARLLARFYQTDYDGAPELDRPSEAVRATIPWAVSQWGGCMALPLRNLANVLESTDR